MNYGETLAYWYLRFNGFFPIVDFVHHPVSASFLTCGADTHRRYRAQFRRVVQYVRALLCVPYFRNGAVSHPNRPDQPTQRALDTYTADSDVLAVRLPYVKEKIADTDVHWDSDRFANWQLDLERHTIGLIVQVKTSDRIEPEEIRRTFDSTRLKYAIERLGFLEPDEVTTAVAVLQDTPTYQDHSKKYVIGKLLICEKTPTCDGQRPYLTAKLLEIHHFLTERLQQFEPRKYGDRLFFPDELMQYMIWRQNHAADLRNDPSANQHIPSAPE